MCDNILPHHGQGNFSWKINFQNVCVSKREKVQLLWESLKHGKMSCTLYIYLGSI